MQMTGVRQAQRFGCAFYLNGYEPLFGLLSLSSSLHLKAVKTTIHGLYSQPLQPFGLRPFVDLLDRVTLYGLGHITIIAIIGVIYNWI